MVPESSWRLFFVTPGLPLSPIIGITALKIHTPLRQRLPQQMPKWSQCNLSIRDSDAFAQTFDSFDNAGLIIFGKR